MNRRAGTLFKLSIVLYALLLTFCNSQEMNVPSNEEISNSLRDKYNGIILPDCIENFSVETITSLLEKPVVIDTLIIAAGNKGNKYFFKALVKSNIHYKIFVELKCTKKIYDLYMNSGLTSFIIATNILQVDSLHVAAELGTITDEILLYNTIGEIFLAGNCLEIIESPRQKEILIQYLN